MKKNILQTKYSSGFKLPKHYFDGLENKILAETKLDTIKNSGFKTPGNYFETIETTILSKVAEEQENTKVISMFTKKHLIYVSSIAAAIVLLFNVSNFDNDLNFDDLDSDTVENYIINEDISSLELASLLTSKELNEANFINYDLSGADIENYILDHIDIEDIILE